MIPLPAIPFTAEEMAGCTTEATKGATKEKRDPPSFFFFFYFMFYCLVTPSTNTSESSSSFTSLIISSISSLETNNINLFLRPPFLLIVLSNLFIAVGAAFEAILLPNPGNLSLTKRIAQDLLLLFSLIYLTKNQEICLI